MRRSTGSASVLGWCPCRCGSAFSARTLASSSRRAGCVPPGHARRAALRPARSEHVLCRRRGVADAGGQHRRARQLRDDEHLYPGKINGQLADTFPMPVTEEVMARGQERFNVYCSPCHGRTGEGNGMIVQRGFRAPPSYHEERLRNAPVGYFFDVDDERLRRDAGLLGAGAASPIAGRLPPTSARCSSVSARRSTTCRPIAAAISIEPPTAPAAGEPTQAPQETR